jgi:surface protein
MIKVTPVSGNLLMCNFQQRFVTTPVQNQAYSSGFLECILSMPNASVSNSITFGGTTIRHAYCEKVDIKTIGNATNLQNMFTNCYSLQSVPLFNTANVTNMQGMFTNCYSLQSVPLFNTINVISMFNLFASCYSIQSVPLFNTINVVSMGYMFYQCYSLQSVPLFNTANVTNMAVMFNSCQSLNFIPAFITTAVTSDFTAFANGSTSINRILMSFNRTVALQNCQLSRDALVEVFTNLVDRTSTTSANIDITGNWGASALTSANRLIATNKNYVIIG